MNFEQDMNAMKRDLIDSLALTEEQQLIMNDWFNRNFTMVYSQERVSNECFRTFYGDSGRLMNHIIRGNGSKIANGLTSKYLLSLEQINSNDEFYIYFRMPLCVMKRTKPDGTK